jgi:16S rRNA C967 or C1407 C5-methylase (RsmB/RsmF family)
VGKRSEKLLSQFLERIEKINPAILEGLKGKEEFSFRINRHIGDLEVVEELKREGFEPKPVEWYRYAFTLPIGDRKRLINSPVYTSHKIYIQNLSSILAALTLEVGPEDWVLDLAAAPGGKSLIFSETAKKVSAVEPVRGRFFRMKRNFKEQKAKNIQTYNKDGRFVYKSCPGWFDKVFLDAPCSSEAHIDLKEGITWWSPRRIQRFSQLQKELILSAFGSLKPGGQMVYATCTFAPEENEGVLDFLVKKFPNARILPVEPPIENWQPGLEKWEGVEFDPQVRHGVRILPKGAYSGFFFAKIEKLG